MINLTCQHVARQTIAALERCELGDHELYRIHLDTVITLLDVDVIGTDLWAQVWSALDNASAKVYSGID